MTAIPQRRERALPAVPPPPPAAPEARSARALREAGELLRRHQRLVVAAQWAMVGAYVVLVVLPALLPASAAAARLAHLAEQLIRGLWWPGVVLTTMLLGQLWCGLLCPDGVLTEAASRRGLDWKIGDRLAWPAWPLALFLVITVYDHLIGGHQAPRPALLILGLSTVAAVAVGAVYARGRRAWCRFLCPTGSLFSLLARCAILHFRVDRAAWDAAPRRGSGPVDCPPMLDVRRLASNEKCNMCGRCSGHRNAVVLAARPLDSELLALEDSEVRTWEALGIVFVLIGLLWSVAHWRSAGFSLAMGAAIRGGPLDQAAPWWVAGTAAGAATWAHGLTALAAVAAGTLALGGATWLALWGAALGHVRRASRLAYALIPLGGTAVLVGALEHAAALFDVPQVAPALRAVLLATGALRSLRAGLHLSSPEQDPRRRWLLRAGLAIAVGLVTFAAAAAPLPR
ncbi:MAG: 4Fe-4S binding protein [Anaeromyxobacter sp.]